MVPSDAPSDEPSDAPTDGPGDAPGDAPRGWPVLFDSPVGRLGVTVSPAGLRRVLLPNSAERAARMSAEHTARMSAEHTARMSAEHTDRMSAEHTDRVSAEHAARASGQVADRMLTGQRPGMAEPDGGVHRAIEQITQYARGERREFELPLDLGGIGPLMRRVLDELCASAPYGKVITYGELARRSDCPGGARAVGQIMARNPLPLVIPCHRVVAAGHLGGYGGGLPLKRLLLRLEGALTEQLSLLADL